MLAAALGKSISGPPENLLCPRDNGGPGPRYSQTSVPGAELLATGRMNALRQGLHGGYRNRTVDSNKSCGTTVQKDDFCNWGIRRRHD